MNDSSTKEEYTYCKSHNLFQMNNRRHFIKTISTAVAGSATYCFATPKGFKDIKALTFDVFGTVVDWRSSIIREGKAMGERKRITVDWQKFANEWAMGYGSSIKRVRDGQLPWTTVENLLRMELVRLFGEFNIKGLAKEEVDNFCRVWQRLTPWPDSVEGLKKLKNQFTIATLSNGNISMLTNLSKHAGIEWDPIISAEHAKRYKTDKEAYLTAARLLKLKPQQIMMVAAHPHDLKAAAGYGFHTALVTRPSEWGKGNGLRYDLAEQRFDLIAKDLIDLAEKMKSSEF